MAGVGAELDTRPGSEHLKPVENFLARQILRDCSLHYSEIGIIIFDKSVGTIQYSPFLEDKECVNRCYCYLIPLCNLCVSLLPELTLSWVTF